MDLCRLWEDGEFQRLYLQCCPWQLILRPDVSQVQIAHKFFSQNQLEVRYPNTALALVDAVNEFDNGYNKGMHDWRKDERDKAKAEKETAEARARRR